MLHFPDSKQKERAYVQKFNSLDQQLKFIMNWHTWKNVSDLTASTE